MSRAIDFFKHKLSCHYETALKLTMKTMKGMRFFILLHVLQALRLNIFLLKKSRLNYNLEEFYTFPAMSILSQLAINN